MQTRRTIITFGILSIIFHVFSEIGASGAELRWYAGTWDSTIYNRAEKPRTVAMRFEIRDSDTDIPVRDAQVTLEGKYLEEWVGRPVDRVGPLEPQEKEFRITAKTNEEGVTVFALSWQKEYPWRTYFGDHEPREYTSDSGSYRIRDSWIRAVDDIEKVQRIEIRHPKYRYKEIPFNFRHLLEFGQDKGSELQRPELFDKFEQAWIKEIKRKNVKFCVLNLGTKFKDFQNKKCRRPEFSEKIRKEDWGTVYQRPYNWFSTGGDPQSECGPYFVYLFDEVPIEKRTLEIEITSVTEKESGKDEVTTHRPPRESTAKEWKCAACGHIYRGDTAPNFCPQCGRRWGKDKSSVATIYTERRARPRDATPENSENILMQTARGDLLGIVVDTLTKERAEVLGLSRLVATNLHHRGVIVKYLLTDSPADRAGLEKNHIIDTIYRGSYEYHILSKSDYDKAITDITNRNATEIKIRCWQFPDNFDGKIDYRNHLKDIEIQLNTEDLNSGLSTNMQQDLFDDVPLKGRTQEIKITSPEVEVKPESLIRVGEFPYFKDWPFDSQEAHRRQKETAHSLDLPIEATIGLGKGVTMEFVLIPAGEFNMGSPPTEKDRRDNEGPVHRVRITKPFYMSKYEVMQDQWLAVMETRESHFTGRDLPVENITYVYTWEFCRQLRCARLPTEAEWEYACRAGSETCFHYGNDLGYSRIGEYAWYKGNSEQRTHGVGQKKSNSFGLYDMYGNVTEWCLNEYKDYKDEGIIDRFEPLGHVHVLDGHERFVIRGSNFNSPIENNRSSTRGLVPFHAETSWIGFRIVLDIVPFPHPLSELLPFDKSQSDKSSGIEDISPDEMIWVKCSNKKCNAEYQMGKKAYYKSIQKYAHPMAPTAPPLVCKKCGKQSVYRAEKCGHPDCGIVFFRGSVPNDFPDRCPECGYSEIEEVRRRRRESRGR